MNTTIYFDQYANKNHASLGTLINRLFEHRSRLLVVRIDLNYLNEYRNLITLERAQEHRERLLDNRRRNHTLFDHLMGYGWSLEHGSCKYDGMGGAGYHHHFVFIYDGAHRQEDICLGLGIANYFRTVITNGMGRCHVSNLDKGKLDERGCLGIGMIHRDDVALRNNLIQRVAGYIAKGSSMPDARSGRSETGDFRTFGRSRLLPPLPENQPRRGRPPIQRN